MKAFTISSKSPFRFGAGTALEAAAKFKELGSKKVFVVLDPTVEKLGLHNEVFDSLNNEGIELVIYNNVMPDPQDTAIDEAGQKFLDSGAEAILGFGGGSCMDLAKGVRVLSANDGPISKLYGRPPLKTGVPMILIATTIGTGSEVSIAAVISDTASGTKPAILSPALQATLAIMDPTFAYGLPKNVLACSVMDVMLHAVETVTSAFRNPNSAIMSMAALKIVAENYHDAVLGTGDAQKEAIEQVAFASTYTALAFNDSMIHFGHHFAHAFGATFHSPHGHCCALVVPELSKYLVGKLPEEMQLVAEAVGVDPKSATLGDDLNKYFKSVSAEIGLCGAKDLGWTLEKMTAVIPGILAHPNMTTPITLVEADLESIVLDIYNG